MFFNSKIASFGFRLPKTRSMDDLLSACDPGSLLTRTSSDPNLNNHCQDIRLGLEPQHPTTEEAAADSESMAKDSPQVPEQQREHPPLQAASNRTWNVDQPLPLQDHRATPQLDCLSSEVELASRACPEATAGTCPALGLKKPSIDSTRAEELLEKLPCDYVKDGLESSGTWDLGATCDPDSSLQPSAGPLVWHPPTPRVLRQDEEDGRRGGSAKPIEEGSPMERAQPEPCRRGISQSQTSEFSLLGANWDSFQGMGTSLPGGDVGPRRLLPYGCCNKRLSSRTFWASGLCLSSQWPLKEGSRLPGCSSHSGSHFAGLAGKASKLWLPCHLKQAVGPKHVSASSPSPVPPLYLDDDGLPFPTDVIQHRLRQIEATYKQEVEQLRRQVHELQLRLDIRHCCAPPAEPPVDYEDDFVSDSSWSSPSPPQWFSSHLRKGECVPKTTFQLPASHPCSLESSRFKCSNSMGGGLAAETDMWIGSGVLAF